MNSNSIQDSLLLKLDALSERKQELETLLATPEIISDQNKFREYSKEYSEIDSVVSIFTEYKKAQQHMQSLEEMMNDHELRQIAYEELKIIKKEYEALEYQLKILLLPKDPADNSGIFLEIRAGTGGEEAALFAAILLKMYMRYAELCNWECEIINKTISERSGYKAIIVRIIGTSAYSRLKFESGVHRVQRVPETESQGRIHTSACTVAILPEVDEISAIKINSTDLRVDTFRASGAGGQHVNKTDSAIRLTHIPTGVVVECQDGRSQHKNRARAMSLLQAKLTQAERKKQIATQAENRKNLVGSGDRSERIRTYNFPQGRITDHRINLTLYNLTEFIEGNIDTMIEPLIHEHQADQLASLIE